MVKQGDCYSSIFFEPDWVLQKYYGWQIVAEQAGFKVLKKCMGPLKRYLVLSRLAHDQLCGELDKLHLFSMLSVVTIKDFSIPSQSGDAELKIGRRSMLRATDAERVLNKYTFAVNLGRETDELWLNMYPDNRRVCKKAIANGMVVETASHPADELLAVFFDRYKKMAQERSLLMPSEALIRKMFAEGRLTLYYAKSGEDICTMALVYSAALTSFFLYGVSGEQKNDGSAQLLHWKIIEHLKTLGQHWYDLGGVPEIDDSNGIYRFKRSLGGESVDLGTEYHYVPKPLSVAKRAYKKLRSIL